MVVLDVHYLMKMEIILDVDEDKQAGRKILIIIKFAKKIDKTRNVFQRLLN